MATPEQTIQAALDQARAGQPGPAIATLRRLLQRQPANLTAAQALGQLLLVTGQEEQGLFQFQRCVESGPRIASFRNNYGMALWQAGRRRESVDQFREAVRLDHQYAIGWIGLSMALVGVPDFDGAAAAARRAIELNPGIGEAHQNLALALLEAGKVEEAVEAFARGLAVAPGNAGMHSTMLIAMNYRDYPVERVLAEHRRFGSLHPPLPGTRPASTDLDPARRLRVGYLSRDFRNHSVGYFAGAMLEHHDRQSIEAWCYSASSPRHDDAVTTRLRGLADRWIDASALDDPGLDTRIRADKIDILVELAGHSAGNRLTALVAKPAPIIVTALGYPNTTGVGAVDYRLVDSLTDPPGAERLATEKLLRLDPCFLCYRAPEGLGDAARWDPSRVERGEVVFGSFNALQKVSPAVIQAWATLLRHLPASRLVVKAGAFDDGPTRDRVAAEFSAAGADPSRIELMRPNQSQAEHLALYGRIDIALDTFPYNGTTTTCEALWMGAPVVTWTGPTHAARVGASLLAAVGLNDLVGNTVDDYTAIAAALGKAPARLASLRAGLRDRMARSVLCDSAAYARRWESALRGIWSGRCRP